MDPAGAATNVNKALAENPCQQHGVNLCVSEACRQYTDSYNHGRAFGNSSSTQPVIDRSVTVQLEFQDSQLSPALNLLPCLEKSHPYSDSTLFHHTDAEFAPLRGFPDLSVMSERCPLMSHVGAAEDSHLQDTLHDQAALSQHPLAVPAAPSEGEISCCSLSQHSLSPGDHSKSIKNQESVSCAAESKIDRHMEGEEQSTAQRCSQEDSKQLLGDGVSTRSLVELSEVDAVVAVSSSNAVSSTSETVFSQFDPTSNQPNTAKNQLEPSVNVPTEFIPQHSISSFKPFPGTAIEGELSSSREQPQGGSLSSSFQKTSGSAVGSDISNITVRNPQAYPRQTTDRLREQLLFEGQRRSNSAPQSRQHSGNRGSHSGLCFTPASGGGTLVSGLQRVLWSSGNLTTTDGSFLSSQPVSQSTPAVPFLRPPLTLTKLPFIHSEQEAVTSSAASSQNIHSRTGLMPALDLSTVDQRFSPIYSQNRVTEFPSGPSIGSGTAHAMSHVHSISEKQGPPPVLSPPASDKPASTGTMMKDQVSHLALSRVQSLPSLSYLQKVDAWKANQSSSRSFYDNLALQGFNGVSPKKKAEDTVSEALSRMLSQQSLSKGMSKASGANGSSQINQPPLSSSHSGSGSPRRVDVVGADVCRGQASESPVTHSHSSLNSVVTSIQRDADTHSQQVPGAQADDIIPPTRSLDTLSSLLSNGKNQGVSSSATSMEKNPVNQSPFFSLGRFSDISSSFNMSSTLSSSQGSCRGEQSMRASVGAASSVVSLEVDNYAPYWNSRPASPPHTRELNIEDRIPLYLQNLGIDQSPSTILNPFTPRGPIREPEFSPTDLCTIKGSVGTPTKSTQPSEVDSSPQKEAFSGSSHVSADSSASVTHRLSEHEQDRPASQRSVTFSQTDTPPRFHSTLHPSSDLQQSHASQLERSFGLPAQLSQESDPPLGPRDEVKGDEDSFVGSGTLHEIRRLLGQAESLVSGRSSLTSSPGSHRLSESDTSLVSLSQNSRSYRDDTSLSVGGNFSLLLTRSSSDSALKDSLSSSRGPQQLSTQTERRTTDPAALSQSREESLKSRDLCVTPRRAEPEGCSAADPDKAKPLTTLPVMQMNVNSLAGSLIPQSQQNSENDVIGSSESSPSHISAEVGSQSDSSSESSLAARVAKLLQSESPVSMVTSRPSTADPEDSRAREWILMKVSGRRCESLELNPEDRARIEDIKRELLLNTRQIKWSSDSEGSVQSSVGSGSQPVKTFIGVRNMESRASEPLQKANPLDSSVSPHVAIQQNLEARVHQIALREGLSPPPLTSITIATTRRTPSPQLTSHGLITGTLNSSSSEHIALEKDSHGRVSDSHFEAVYPEQRHEPATIQNISDREEEMEGEGEQRENKKIEEMTDNRENIMKNDLQTDHRTAHMDYIATSSNQILSSSNKSHLSQIHVTLSPKACQVITQRPQSSPSEITISPKQSDSVKYHSTRLSDQNTFKDVLPQRHSHTMSSTADEHLVTSTSNQVNSYKNREQVQSQNADTVGSCLQASFRYPQSFTSSQRLIGTSRAISIQSGAAPTLLPYKPHGSSELFYVPQADAELSPDRSDTTIESSHPGSDDAVPPRFSTDILGSRELEDNIVTPKHKEGIYSKKANMKRGAWRFDSTAPEGSDVSEKDLEAVYMNEQYENEEENFVPLHMEADYSTDDFHLHSNTMQESKLPQEPRHLPSKPIRKAERTNQKTKDRRPHDVSVEISSSLDQLWCRFSERWSMEEARPTNEGETSLLERLERLSRLIHSTTPAHKPVKQPESRRRDYDRRSDQVEAMRGGEERNSIEVPQQAWAEHEEEQENLHRCPAERDESSSVSVETSSSLSTIDTERLLRAFGPQRVPSKGLKNSDSLLRLYNNINKQKTGSRKPSSKHAAVSTDDSTVSPDSLSASSILSLPSQRGVSQSFTTKRPKVKLVSKGVQAGDLEIVINGTRKHTRDVGTIFPSPGVSRNARPAKAFSKSVQDVTSILTVSTANPTHTITALKRDTCDNSTRTQYQNGVSWFVSADELKSDGRKENQPESESRPCTSQAWFEPHCRTQPWREPTREPLRERQIQVEQERPTEPKTAIETENSKPLSLVRISLQEALALHRPEFVSRSRERIKRLGLLVEERRLQAVFNREREELFNCPGPSRPLRPAPVPRKRVVPRREMVERSKHWLGKKSHTQRIDRTNKIRRKYSQLPEVQKRKEEERRRAEYRSYRLNARLFNKKVTNRVLGKRAPWQ